MNDLPDQLDDDVLRIQLTPALPCGIPGCGNLTCAGLVEHDPQTPGLWHLLPLCDECARGRKPHGASDQPQDQPREHLTA